MISDMALGPTAQSPAPVMKADLRPTADAAALARDPRPDVPLPIPASNGQSAAVTQSKVTASTKVEKTDAALQAERVLKPYGVAMLPDVVKQPEEPKEDDVAKDKPTPEKAEAKPSNAPSKAKEPAESKPAEPMIKADKEDPPVTAKKEEPVLSEAQD